MTRDDLLTLLRKLAKSDDPEVAHGEADDALIAYIADGEIGQAYAEISKWYA